MPVAEGYRYVDEVHPLMVERPRYGCHDHPQRVPHNELRQDGWTEDGRRHMVEGPVACDYSLQCGHLEARDDPRCEGCCWRHSQRVALPD